MTPQQREWLGAALRYAHGTHTIEDVEAGLESGALGLLAGERSALVVEVVTYPRKRILNVFLAGGDMDDVKAWNDPLAKLAKGHDCSDITLAGRRGWVRALKDIGWSEVCTTVGRPAT